MIANSLPQKKLDSSSMNSTPIEKEPVMECPLLLTTLSGVTFQVSLSVAKFDRWVGGWGTELVKMDESSQLELLRKYTAYCNLWLGTA